MSRKGKMMLPRRLQREMNEISLEQWLQRIERIHPEEVELGLERVSEVAQRLRLLPVQPPVVIVGGTNGKGSTVAVLEALLNEAGYSTGCLTSPHLLRFNERIRVAGVDVQDAEIIEAFAAIEAARGTVSLTYFEFSTLAALLIFRAREVDTVILEVGLGGRLDAVNMVDPSVAVITSIDLDHQNWLGDSRGEIAREKAGIMRRSRPVVIAELDPPAELEECVSAVGAEPAFFLGREFSVSLERGEWCADLQLKDGTSRRIGPLSEGSLLPQNVAAAAQAAVLLGVGFTDDCLLRALSNVALLGRRQLCKVAGREYVLDVAHNPAATTKLLEFLDETPCSGKTICLFSVMADKDAQCMIELAAGHFQAWFLADQPDIKRAAHAADLASMLGAAQQSMISISRNIRQALRRAQSVMTENDRLVIFGSFYTVAAVLPFLDTEFDKYEAH